MTSHTTLQIRLTVDEMHRLRRLKGELNCRSWMQVLDVLERSHRKCVSEQSPQTQP